MQVTWGWRRCGGWYGTNPLRLRALNKDTFPPKGQFCTEDVDECLLQPNACQNGGTCTNRNGGYGCVCVNGWSGDDCSENIDDCAFASCTPGSTCIDRVASFSCMCPEGKAGKAGRRTELERVKGLVSIQDFCLRLFHPFWGMSF